MHPKKLLRSLIGICAMFAPALTLVGPAWAQVSFNTIYEFKGGTDGNWPTAGPVSDAAGNLYGTTREGGAFDAGTVYELTPASGGTWTESILYSFTGGADGSTPVAELIFDSSGNLYSTTNLGGSYGHGTVFELSPGPEGWTESVLYNFKGRADGWGPAAKLVFDSAGNLYGTTWNGGDMHYCGDGCGIVFELSPAADGTWTETVLYTFRHGPDLNNPGGPLTFDGLGNIYSTCWYGGMDGNGGVFELSPNAGGTWTEKILYRFRGGNDGASPKGGVVFDSAGNLYGLTGDWVGSDESVVFELSPESGGFWKKSDLYRSHGCSGCIYANAGLTFDASSGNLFGNDIYGGPYGGTDGGPGFVFEMTPNGAGGWTYKRLYNFNGEPGEYPFGILMVDAAGNVYGTTAGNQGPLFGTVFEITGANAR